MEEKDLHTAVWVYTTRMEAQCASICVDFLQNRIITSCRHIEMREESPPSCLVQYPCSVCLSFQAYKLRLDIQLIQLYRSTYIRVSQVLKQARETRQLQSSNANHMPNLQKDFQQTRYLSHQ